MSFNNSAVNACKGLFFFLSLAFTRDPLTSYHLTSVISWSSEPETFINSRGFTSINSRTLRKSFDSCSIRLRRDFVAAFRTLRLKVNVCLAGGFDRLALDYISRNPNSYFLQEKIHIIRFSLCF